jgi:SAM-dependent methyltransferase
MAGIQGDEPDALERFDELYFGFYPYLRGYVDRLGLPEHAPVLEIGLGYGSLGGYIAGTGSRYHGLDIAPTPVSMMRHRLSLRGEDDVDSRVVQGSALAIPWADETFEAVLSIGCLHHTGDLGGSIREVHRVLKPGGRALVMVYNRYSARQLYRVDRRRALASLGLGRARADDQVRADYDANATGEAAPHTDFTSRKEARELFSSFRSLAIEPRNFDDITIRGRRVLGRSTVLSTPLPRLLGLDLYLVAVK